MNNFGKVWSSTLFSRLAVPIQLKLTISSTYLELFYISTYLLPFSVSGLHAQLSCLAPLTLVQFLILAMDEL